jgi:hypothetical protein
MVAPSPLAVVCLVRLLRELQISTGGAVDLHAFRGFNGRLVAKNPRATAPGPKKITYDQFLRFLSLIMVQWSDGRIGGNLHKAVCHVVRKERWCLRGVQCGRSNGIVG